MAESLVDRPANLAGWSVPVMVDAVRPVQDRADSVGFPRVNGHREIRQHESGYGLVPRHGERAC
jgi:hypothetical protein